MARFVDGATAKYLLKGDSTEVAAQFLAGHREIQCSALLHMRQSVAGSFARYLRQLGTYRFHLLTLIGPMSSHTRQRFLLHQIQCRAQIDTVFYNVYVGFPQAPAI